jgi:hypothetical protein
MASDPEATSTTLLSTTAVSPCTPYAQLRCPFPIQPRQRDDLSIERTSEISFLQTPDDQVPWTGYYTERSGGAHIAVENYAGVWFEIERDGPDWRTIRVARPELGLVHAPENEIDMTALEASGRPIPNGRQETGFSVASDDEPMTQQPSSTTTAQRPPPSPLEGADSQLIGIPPKFEGDRADAISFLTEFELFMILNSDTQVAKDPIKRAAYFLNIIGGRVMVKSLRYWVKRNSEWLLRVTRDRDILPGGMNAWDVLEADFKKYFKDYSGPEVARIELEKLSMMEDKEDDYIAEFEYLAHRAGYGKRSEPYTVRLFVRGLVSGLPRKLVEACITEYPQTLDECISKVRTRILNERVYRPSRHRERENNPPNRGAFVRGRDIPPPRPRTSLRDSNPIAAVGANRKAINEDDKERYLRQGLCFHCGEQGHLARDCPDRSHQSYD